MTAAQWAARLNIQYTPSLVFFDEQGREVFRSEAYLRTFHIQSVMDYIASGAYRRQPNLQRFIQERADHLREQGVVVDLMD
jgi:thioredoxin-related protein